MPSVRHLDVIKAHLAQSEAINDTHSLREAPSLEHLMVIRCNHEAIMRQSTTLTACEKPRASSIFDSAARSSCRVSSRSFDRWAREAASDSSCHLASPSARRLASS